MRLQNWRNSALRTSGAAPSAFLVPSLVLTAALLVAACGDDESGTFVPLVGADTALDVGFPSEDGGADAGASDAADAAVGDSDESDGGADAGADSKGGADGAPDTKTDTLELIDVSDATDTADSVDEDTAIPPLDVDEDAVHVTDSGADGGADSGSDVEMDADTQADTGPEEGAWVTAAPNFGHANMVRLGDDHLVVAWTPSPEVQPSGGEVHFRVYERDGETLDAGLATIYPWAMLSPGSDQGIALMGALGPEHFFAILTAPGYTRSIHWFRRDGFDITPLGNQAFGSEAFFMGHPVDDTRYLLRYRPNNSGEPVHYRLIERTGDTFAYGADITRPPPSSFPGTDDNEPQTFAPLARIGPGTFREMRAGYVWPISPLTSWTLTVKPDGTMTATDPQVHSNSANQVMGPRAAADGTGGIFVIYGTYNAGHHWGTFDPAAGGAYVEGGLLGATNMQSIQTEGQESTDGYYDGRYYARTPSGTLYSVSGLDGMPVVVADDLPHTQCYRAPSMIRSGPLGVFMVCVPEEALRLWVLPL